MSFRFTRRIKILPGVTVNLGNQNVSVRLGTRHMKYTVGTAGKRISAGIPGAGIYYTDKLDKKETPVKAALRCPECEKRVAKTAKFCANCGAKLAKQNSVCVEQDKNVRPEPPLLPVSWVRDINGHKIDVLKLALDFNLFDGKIKSQTAAQMYLQKHAGVGFFKSRDIVVNNLLKDEALKHAYEKHVPPPQCPECLSTSIKITRVGYSFKKGIVGGLLTGGIGVVAGFHGSRNRQGKCLKCGHKWKL